MLEPFGQTVEGFELHFGVNCLGHFYLTRMLLPLLAQKSEPMAGPARIIYISSITHRIGTLDLGWLSKITSEAKAEYSSHAAYARSKLAVQLISYALADYITSQGLEITVNTADPGIVNTDLYRNVNPCLRWIKDSLAPYLFRSAAQAARMVVWIACSEDLNTTNGIYFGDYQPQTPAACARDRLQQRQLWDICCEAISDW